MQKSASRYDLVCLILAPGSFHNFGSGSRPTLLEDAAPGESATWLRVCPESRSPACWITGELPAPGLEPSTSARKPLTILLPRRQCQFLPRLSPPVHSLLQELLQPTGLQHKVTHIHIPQLIPGVAQGLVDEQVHSRGACKVCGREAMWGH